MTTSNSGSDPSHPVSGSAIITARAAVASTLVPASSHPLNLAELSSLSEIFLKSGFFRDAKDAAQCVTKMIYGAELGLGPMQSMMGVYIVDGKPTLSAATIATLIKRSGRYTYRVTRLDAEACVITFFERTAAGTWEEAGGSGFTMADAQAAGLAGKGPWKAYARNMLWARALTNGARWYCADVFGGAVYTPEEMGAPVDADGAPVAPPPPPSAAPFAERATAAPAQPPPARVTARTVEAITARAAANGWSAAALAALIEDYGVTALLDLTAGQARELYNRLAHRAPAGADDPAVEEETA